MSTQNSAVDAFRLCSLLILVFLFSGSSGLYDENIDGLWHLARSTSIIHGCLRLSTLPTAAMHPHLPSAGPAPAKDTHHRPSQSDEYPAEITARLAIVLRSFDEYDDRAKLPKRNDYESDGESSNSSHASPLQSQHSTARSLLFTTDHNVHAHVTTCYRKAVLRI
ncbi:hypothetical protein Bbelb_263920 [Branchiostoma belcheri]|nr:hypothetical protein Bbelb_263920 [Branchiostoma belcheri]